MKRIAIFLLLFISLKSIGQTTGYLRFDTVRIFKQGGTSELYLINSTKDSLGQLTNVGGGLTRFIKPKVLNDSTLVVGLDTLIIRGSGGGGSTTTTIVRKPFLVYAGSGSDPDTLDFAIGYGLMRNPADSSLQVDSTLYATQYDISTIGGGGDTSHVTNVRDFGAIGDGTTDNTIAINAAIQAATTNGKPIVYFPTGVWGIRSAYRDTAVVYQPTGIKVESNITLIGAGQGNSVIKILPPPASSTFSAVSAPVNYTTNTSFNHIIWGNNVSNVVIRDLSIHGNLANQINYNVNPYLTPQDSTYTDSCETDAIKFWFGSNNKVINVRIDSVAGYGVGFFASTNGLVSNCVITTSVNGAVYFKRYSDGGAVLNSYITNNHCDNIRIRSNNILVQGNEISWTKFNPNVAQANFAGVYIESDSSTNLMPPSIMGVKILGNYIHNNSSFGVDGFNRDTLIYTAQGYSVLIANNTISYNSNAGITMHMPMMEIRNNQIFENGANSNNVSDPVTLKQAGISATSFAVGSVISGNSFRDTRGFQDYAVSGAAGDYPRMLQVTNNTMQGGVSFMQAVSNAWDNPFYGNTRLANAGASVQSDFFQRQLTGNLLISPEPNGVDFFNGTGNGYSAYRYPSNGEAGIVGQQAPSTNHLSLLFDSRARWGGTAGTTGRGITFYDFQNSLTRGGINADGDLIWGLNPTTFSLRARQRGVDLSNIGQVEVTAAGSGSTANAVQSGLYVTMATGYTGSGTHPAIRFVNSAITSGNNIGGAGGMRGALGFYGGATGATTNGSNIGGFAFSTSGLRNVGLIGDATVSQNNNASAHSIGVIGYALRNHASAVHVGGYFGLQSTQPTFENGALIADNGATGHELLKLRTNGTNSFIVRTTGNTAINTTATTSAVVDRKLYVDGSIGQHPDSSETITSIGSNYVQIIDATSGKFKKITGANLGAGGVIVESNEYTPTLTAVTNLDGVTLVAAHYYRIGNLCQVYIEFSADPTTAAECVFGATLPVASEITSSGEIIGSGAVTTASNTVETVVAGIDATNNRANIVFTATGVISRNYRVAFSYKITPP